ncbi:hypothetical protein U9M48_025424 [Paspalum notatum var. saurae]|uniref:Uncharacterized protein n=1 Tax=Paspalum notatum var. saurae TaxID=547442 RepID=A0AAQ3TTK7_PASNO
MSGSRSVPHLLWCASPRVCLEAPWRSSKLMARVSWTGKAFLASTVVGGRLVLRFAVGSTLQEQRHVRSAWDLIKKTTAEILQGAGTAGIQRPIH